MAALVRARRGQVDEARDLLEAALEHRTQGSAVTPEVDCDIVAETGDWDRADKVLARARDLSARGGLLGLPAYSDRLEGRAALAAGDATKAVERLELARGRFHGLGARWEQACTELRLAEAHGAVGDPAAARTWVLAAMPVFDELGSLREIGQARDLLGRQG